MHKLGLSITLMFGALLMALPAQACDNCTTPADTAACCSRRVFEISKILKHHLHCEFPEHRCALPLSIDCEICVSAPAHQCIVPCTIDREICLDPPCHRPAIALKPVECCKCGVELSGSKDLIVVCDACSSK